MSAKPDLQGYKDAMANQAYGMTTREAHSRGICIQCRKNAMSGCHTELGIKEYYISGLCEDCFDTLFKE